MRWHAFLILAVGTAALAGPASFAADTEQPAASLEDARTAFEDERLEDCVKACAAIPEEHPDHFRALYLQGESQMLLRRHAEAEKSFRAVLASRPKSVPALSGLGRALFARNEREAAEEPLRKAVELDKKSVLALRSLGDLLAATGRGGEARTLLLKAWKLDKKNPLTALSLVDVHLGHNDAASSEKVAKTLKKALPDHPSGHFLLGRALEKKGKWKDAIEAYEKALEKDEKYLDAHRNIAILAHSQNPMYGDEKLLAKSMSHYERYFELGGNEPALKRIYEQMKAFLESWKGKTGR